MPRLPRTKSETGYYHVMVRGNNKQRVFHQSEDLHEYIYLMGELAKGGMMQVSHYCLMNNHAHMLLKSESIEELSSFMHSLQRSYHHYYRKKYTWFGHLFQGRYRSLPINDDGYLLECGRYIERNPVSAKIVEKPSQWEYSSYQYYVTARSCDWLSYSPAYLGLSREDEDRRRVYREYVEVARPQDEHESRKRWEG